MQYLISLRHNQVMCKFCGIILDETECNDRGVVWYETPKHKCSDIEQLNKLQGSRQIDAKGIVHYIKENQRFFYKDKKIFDKDGNVCTISDLKKSPVKCSCGFSALLSEYELQPFGESIYACPECGILRKIKE